MLLFGVVSCVWGYNRVGVALVILARTLLGIPCLHYADDYGGIEPTTGAELGGKCTFRPPALTVK